jgi:uncharacterized protein DUF4349
MSRRGARIGLGLAALALLWGCSSIDRGPAEFARVRQESPDRKIVRSGEIAVTVATPAEAELQVQRIVTEAGGLVESSHVAAANVSLHCRVPADRLDAAMDAIAALGTEERRSISATDVTEQHFDLSTRLANNLALRDRLKRLLDRATDVEDVLAIEKELTRIQSEIETMQASVARLDSQVALSELAVTLERRQILGPLGYVAYGAWWAISKLFVIR